MGVAGAQLQRARAATVTFVSLIMQLYCHRHSFHCFSYICYYMLCTMNAALLIVLALALAECSLAAENFYDLKAQDAAGKEVSLEQYRGKVSLVVNVASECGYTDHNYRELVELQQDLGQQGLIVLAFPCNQFGEQEPGTMQQISAFAETYGINFPLFSKIDVMGKEASAVYSFLFRATRTLPQWNFCKYVVDRDGSVKQFFSQKGDFAAIRQAIQYLLNKQRKEL